MCKQRRHVGGLLDFKEASWLVRVNSSRQGAVPRGKERFVNELRPPGAEYRSKSNAASETRAFIAAVPSVGAKVHRSRAGSRPPLSLHPAVLHARCYSHGSQESDEEFDARWVTYFNKPDIDAWELRKGINTLVGYDLVPEPKIIDAALRACRRLNDFASAVRILEVVKDKAGPHKEIYPYVIQELRPTLSELGISTPEELGLDKA
ncbi:Cytochrome c oxidase subunit 5A, mitochondrial [Aix galericulata]|nr:Cytochrome c oxidase subunit 5A, mitochondrial [Aix galericulata]